MSGAAATKALTQEGLGVTYIPLRLGAPSPTALNYTSPTALGVQITRLQAFYNFLGLLSCGSSVSTGDNLAFSNNLRALQSTLLDILTQLVNADQAQLAFVHQELTSMQGLIAQNASLTAQVQGNPLPVVAPPPAPPAPPAPSPATSSTSASASAPLPSTSAPSAPAPASSPWPWGIGGSLIGGILGFAVGRKTAKKR